jgi:hypothetical protein
MVMALARLRVATKHSLFVDVNTDPVRHISEISDAAKTTAQATLNWINLRNTGHYRVHESENVEGHLFGRENVNSVDLNFLGDHIGFVHETSTTSPAER